jgi:hypothetical protein
VPLALSVPVRFVPVADFMKMPRCFPLCQAIILTYNDLAGQPAHRALAKPVARSPTLSVSLSFVISFKLYPQPVRITGCRRLVMVSTLTSSNPIESVGKLCLPR